MYCYSIYLMAFKSDTVHPCCSRGCKTVKGQSTRSEKITCLVAISNPSFKSQNLTLYHCKIFFKGCLLWKIFLPKLLWNSTIFPIVVYKWGLEKHDQTYQAALATLAIKKILIPNLGSFQNNITVFVQSYIETCFI